MKKKNSIWLPLKSLVLRNINIFIKDKWMVFFSILAPVIVLLLYILFLGNMQVDNITTMIQSGRFDYILDKVDPAMLETTLKSGLKIAINNWMIAGVMSVSCITVAFNSCTTMVRDKTMGRINDVFAAPIPKWVVFFSYICSSFLITFTICFAVLFFGIIYLACTHGLVLSIGGFFCILGCTVLSVLSASFFMVILVSFIKTTSALTSFNSVFSAVIGFLIGAYLPIGMLPKPVQYLCLFIPGTYSSGLFRTLFMQGPVDYLSRALGVTYADVNALLSSYKVNMEFFGMPVSTLAMILVLIVSIIVFAALIIIFYSNKRTNYFAMAKKHIKTKKKSAKKR